MPSPGRERAPHRAVVHAGLQAADRDHTGVRDASQGRQQHEGSGTAAGHAAPVKGRSKSAWHCAQRLEIRSKASIDADQACSAAGHE